MTQLPSNQTAILSVAENQSLALQGDVNQLTYDGSSDFTIAFWARVSDTEGSPTLLSCPNNLLIRLENSQVNIDFPSQPAMAALSGGPPLRNAGSGLIEGTWHHIAVAAGVHPEGVGEPNPGDGRVASIFVDGMWVAYQSIPAGLSATSLSGAVTLGGSSDLQFRSLHIFSYGLNELQVNSLKFAGSANALPEAPVAAWDFGTYPPTLSGSATGLDGMVQHYATVGTSFLVPQAAAAKPGTGDTPNPANGTDSFSIQTWFYPTTLNTVVPAKIFSNGTGGEAYVSIQVVGEGDGMKVIVSYGRQTETVSSLPLNTWVNVALVYDNVSNRLMLYINGALRVTGSASSSQTRGVPYMAFGPFPGYLQNVNIWDRALSGDEIQQYIYSAYSANDGALTAVYDFVNAPISNLVSGIPITYSVGYSPSPAPIEYIAIPVDGSSGATTGTLGPLAIQAEQASATQTLAKQSAELASIKSVSGLGGFDRSKINAKDFDASKVSDYVATIKESMPKRWSTEEKAVFLSSAGDHVKRTFAQAAAGELPSQCLITCERIGDDQVFFHHTETGMRAVAKTSASSVDECLAWKISVVATGLFGLLSLFDVPTSSGTVSTVITELIGKSSKLASAFGDVLESTINGYTIIALVNALADNGYFWTFIKDILSSLSWWDFLFFSGELGVEILALLMPEVELAIFIAKLAVAVSELIYAISQCPPGCVV